MADNRFVSQNSCCSNEGFKEAVCVDVPRIYDSCSAKDCCEDLQVYFTDADQAVVDNAVNIKCKKVSVLHVYMDVQPVTFNKGFYSVDMTFFFKVTLEAYTSPVCKPVVLNGLSIFSKKVILYGSEGNVSTFSTDKDVENRVDFCGYNLPTASVQVVDPMCLACRVCEFSERFYEQCSGLPNCVACHFDGDFCCRKPEKNVLITIGIFSIVNLQRTVQLMIPAYDVCIPEKECCTTSDEPCEVFKHVKFPIDDFFPPKLSNDGFGCGCNGNDREPEC